MKPRPKPRAVTTTRKDLAGTIGPPGFVRAVWQRLGELFYREPVPVSNPLEALLGPPPKRSAPLRSDVEDGELVAADAPGNRTSRRVAGAAAEAAPEPATNPAPSAPDPRDLRLEALALELGKARAERDLEHDARIRDDQELHAELEAMDREIAGMRAAYARREHELRTAGEALARDLARVQAERDSDRAAFTARVQQQRAENDALARELDRVRGELKAERASDPERGAELRAECEALRRERDGLKLIAEAASRKTAEVLRELHATRKAAGANSSTSPGAAPGPSAGTGSPATTGVREQSPVGQTPEA